MGKKAALYFFSAALFISFIVQRKINNKKTAFKKCLLTVAIDLIDEHTIQYLGIEEAELRMR
jgi:hypothetical protein